MPYQAGNRLPGEKASKLGHLDVLKSELVNNLVKEFESPEIHASDISAFWQNYENSDDPLKLILATDGSLQIIRTDFPPRKEMAFIKTVLFRLDQIALSNLDQKAPHPLALRDIMSDSALYHATVFPLKNVSLKGLSNYHAVRQIIFDSFKDAQLNAEPMKTLKWLAYEKWSGVERRSPEFECPHCSEPEKKRIVGGLPYDTEIGNCEHCNQEVLLSDMLGFHLEMAEDAVPESVASAYMLIHETLLLFTGIRHFWESKKFNMLQKCLFVKDGPLSLRGQYVKLVKPIRNLFEFAKAKGITIHMVGQEKSGAFFDHAEVICQKVEGNRYFLLSNDYIRKEIQKKPDRGEEYGYRTNYGNKIIVKADKHNFLVLSIPTGTYTDSSAKSDFIGFDKILGTLHTILSNRFQGGLVPVELANGIASLSTYPSAKILKVFAEI